MNYLLFDPFVLHRSIISFTPLLPHPIVESHLSHIKDIDVPYHYSYGLYTALMRLKCGNR